MCTKDFFSSKKLVTTDISGVFLGYHKTSKLALIIKDKSNRILRTSAYKEVKCVISLKSAGNARSVNSEPAVVIGGGGGYLFNRGLVVDDIGGPDEGMEDINMDSVYSPSDAIIYEGDKAESRDRSSGLQLIAQNSEANRESDS